MTRDTEWDDTAKAQWILENGPVPDHAWIFERVGDQVFKRPMAASDATTPLPPWINREREPVLRYTAPGYDIQDLDINEHTRSTHD